MKRVVAALTLLIIALGVGWWWRWSGHTREGPWQHLPAGGEGRILAITHGTLHQYRKPPPPLMQRFGDAFRARSAAPFRLPPSETWSSPPNGPGPSLGVWVEYRGAKRSILSGMYRLTLPDGQFFQTRRTSITSWSATTGALGFVSVFGYVPVRPKTLRYAWNEGGQDVVFEFNNPAHRTDLPVWKSAPLPQTRQEGSLALTLRGIIIGPRTGIHSEHAPVGWEAHPDWSISRDSQPADQWFSVEQGFEDPSGQTLAFCGLFSEPVWKIRSRVFYKETFPFRDDEIHWLGTAGPESPGDQAKQLFTVDAGTGATGLDLAGVFGPGEHWYQGKAIVRSGPVLNINVQRFGRLGALNGELQISLDKPALVVIGTALLIARDAEGRLAPLKILQQGPDAFGTGLVRIFELPATPVRIGATEPKAAEFEFFIASPGQAATPR